MKIVVNKHSNLFFCSDPHYGHRNLVRGISTWEDKSRTRDFKTLAKHDETLIKNINDTVGEDDVLICLGDWNFGPHNELVNYAIKFRRAINCKNVHLVFGNHDHHLRDSHEILKLNLFKSTADLQYITVIEDMGSYCIKTKVIACHYAMRVWDGAHKGSYMLYGHSHGSIDNQLPKFPDPTWIGDNYFVKNSKSMDVGFDAHPEFRPFSWQEIREILSKREVTFNVDYHGIKE